MAGIVGNASMGPGSPTPVSDGYRQPTLGKPSLAYNHNAQQVQSTVGIGKSGSALAASFEPREPMRPPGIPGLGQTGAFVDARA